MFNKIVAIALVCGMMLLPGCSGKSNVQTYDENLTKRSLYHDTQKSKSLKYAFEALNKIMEFYEDQVMKNMEVQSQKALFSYTAYDKTGKKIVGKYEVADVTSGYVSIINNMTIAQSRERVIREFAPIFEDIASTMVAEGKPPKSWIDVASEFVTHIPLMASMGAMYGLGTAAIDKAGNVINANLKDNAQLNNNNIVGNGNATDGSSILNQDISGSDIANDKSNHDSGNTELPKEDE